MDFLIQRCQFVTVLHYHYKAEKKLVPNSLKDFEPKKILPQTGLFLPCFTKYTKAERIIDVNPLVCNGD